MTQPFISFGNSGWVIAVPARKKYNELSLFLPYDLENVLRSCAELDTQWSRRSVHIEKESKTSISKDLHAFSYLPNCPEKKPTGLLVFLWLFYNVQWMNYIKYNCLKMVFQSRLHFRTFSLSDVFCNYISENPEVLCKFCMILYF